MKKINLTLCACCAFFLPLKAQTEWSLDDCIHYAINHNLQIDQAKTNYSLAAIKEKEVHSGWIPDISANMNHLFSLGQSPSSNGLYLNNNSFSMNINLDFNMPLFSALELYWQKKIAEQEKNAALYSENHTIHELICNITYLYFQCVCQKEIVSFSEKQLHLTTNFKNKLESLFVAGKTDEKEIMECEAQIASAEMEMISAKYQYKNLISQLCRIMEKADTSMIDVPFVADIQTNIGVKFSLQDIYQFALQHDASVLAARAQLKQHQLQYKQQQASVLPQLQLTSSYNNGFYAYSSIDNNPFAQQLANNGRLFVGFILYQPILSRNTAAFALQSAKIKQQQAEINLKQTEKQLWYQLQQYYLQYESAKEKLNACEKKYSATLKVFEHVTAIFDMSKITVFEYHTCQMQTYQAHVEAMKALGEYLFLGKILDYYTGYSF